MKRRSFLISSLMLMALFGSWNATLVGQLAPTPVATVSGPRVEHDTRLVAPNAMFAFFVKPAEIAQVPDLKQLITMIEQEESFRARFGVPISAISRVSLTGVLQPVVQLNGKQRPVGLSTIEAIDVARCNVIFANMTKDYKPLAVPNMRLPIMVEGAALESAQAGDWKDFTVISKLDERTVINTERGTSLAIALTPANGATSLWQPLYSKVATSHLAMAVDLVQFRKFVKDEMGERAPAGGIEGLIFNSVATVWTKADCAVLGIDAQQGIQVNAWLQSANEQDAKQVAGTLEGLIGIGRGMLPSTKPMITSLDAQQPGLGTKLFAELEALVSTIKVTQSGNQTVLAMNMKQETVSLAVGAMLPMIVQARQAARETQSMNNLKQIALAMHNYHDAYAAFPAAVMLGPDGKTPHSWRVALLPFMEQQALYKQYNLNEPWDSENNKKVLAMLPQVYRSPAATNGLTSSSYYLLTNNGGMFTTTPAAKGTLIRNITDGTSNTIMAVEANAEIPWTKPEDLPIAAGQALPVLGQKGAQQFIAAMADGSVHKLPITLKLEQLLPFVTRGGGEVIQLDQINGAPRPNPMPGAAPPGAVPPQKALPQNAPPGFAPPPGAVPPPGFAVPPPAVPVPAPR